MAIVVQTTIPHEVAVAVELDEGQTALDKAKSVPRGKLSYEQQARYLIDVASPSFASQASHPSSAAIGVDNSGTTTEQLLSSAA